MERKELVVGLKNTLKTVTESLVAAMNEIRTNMNKSIAIIAKEKQELTEDFETLTDISVALDDFVVDITDVAVDMDKLAGTVDDILDNLDDIPDNLDDIPDELVISTEEEDAPDGWVECDDEDEPAEIAE